MRETSIPRGVLRFGDFELDVAGYELRGSGRSIRLERQPMDLLIMLVERRGQLVSREDIVGRLWGKDVFVDVETGVHTAVRKIRRALRDSSDEPVFIETVSGRAIGLSHPSRSSPPHRPSFRPNRSLVTTRWREPPRRYHPRCRTRSCLRSPGPRGADASGSRCWRSRSRLLPSRGWCPDAMRRRAGRPSRFCRSRTSARIRIARTWPTA